MKVLIPYLFLCSSAHATRFADNLASRFTDNKDPVEEIIVGDRPEGVTNGRWASEILIGQVLTGEILGVDVLTGSQRTVVKPSDNGARQAWGLAYAEVRTLNPSEAASYIVVAHCMSTRGT